MSVQIFNAFACDEREAADGVAVQIGVMHIDAGDAAVRVGRVVIKPLAGVNAGTVAGDVPIALVGFANTPHHFD